MSDTTPRLSLLLLNGAQAQKHVTHNEPLLVLNRLVHLTVAGWRNEPPALPAEDACHLVDGAPTGAFSGHAGEVATFEAGTWRSTRPRRAGSPGCWMRRPLSSPTAPPGVT